MTDFNARAVIRGGDRWLFQWKINSPAVDASTLEVLANYEGREEWVRSLLNCNSLEDAKQFILTRFPRVKSVVGINIGQEEDRSSGLPVRFAKVLIEVSHD